MTLANGGDATLELEVLTVETLGADTLVYGRVPGDDGPAPDSVVAEASSPDRDAPAGLGAPPRRRACAGADRTRGVEPVRRGERGASRELSGLVLRTTGSVRARYGDGAVVAAAYVGGKGSWSDGITGFLTDKSGKREKSRSQLQSSATR